MTAFLHRPLPIEFVVAIIGGSLSGLAVALLIIGTGAPPLPLFVAYHSGLAVGAGVSLWGVSRVR